MKPVRIVQGRAVPLDRSDVGGQEDGTWCFDLSFRRRRLFDEDDRIHLTQDAIDALRAIGYAR